jgi:hypothetical protein
MDTRHRMQSRVVVNHVMCHSVARRRPSARRFFARRLGARLRGARLFALHLLTSRSTSALPPRKRSPKPSASLIGPDRPEGDYVLSAQVILEALCVAHVTAQRVHALVPTHVHRLERNTRPSPYMRCRITAYLRVTSVLGVGDELGDHSWGRSDKTTCAAVRRDRKDAGTDPGTCRSSVRRT